MVNRQSSNPTTLGKTNMIITQHCSNLEKILNKLSNNENDKNNFIIDFKINKDMKTQQNDYYFIRTTLIDCIHKIDNVFENNFIPTTKINEIINEMDETQKILDIFNSKLDNIKSDDTEKIENVEIVPYIVFSKEFINNQSIEKNIINFSGIRKYKIPKKFDFLLNINLNIKNLLPLDDIYGMYNKYSEIQLLSSIIKHQSINENYIKKNSIKKDSEFSRTSENTIIEKQKKNKIIKKTKKHNEEIFFYYKK